MRYLVESKFLRNLAQKKHFGLIQQVAFKLGYCLCQGKKDTSFEFE